MFELPHFFAQHSRRIIAITAISLSLLGAIGLAAATQTATPIWAAVHELAPGSMITAADITRVDATLGASQKRYYPATSRLIGNVVTRPVGAFEFIPTNALAQAGATTDMRQLPLGIAKSDLPADLGPGDRVDLYEVPKDASHAPGLVGADIRVQSVDNKSRDLGGSVTVLFLLHQKDILPIMDSLTSGRIVVVRNAL